MRHLLAGRRALIVGAGSGIGRAVAARFLAEGADVGVLERDPGKAADLAATHPDLPIVVGDAADPGPHQEAVAACISAFGGLDVLINCVGIFDYYRSIEDLTDEEIDAAFDEVFRINVRSCLHAVKAALPALRHSTAPVVILTESTSSYYPGRGGPLYVGSKFAVRGLVVALAHDLAPDIRVNAVAPGGTLGTDLRGSTSLGSGDRSLGDSIGSPEKLAARVPLQLALEPDDHAWSYVFLASAMARGMTGESLHPDAGARVAGVPRKRS